MSEKPKSKSPTTPTLTYAQALSQLIYELSAQIQRFEITRTLTTERLSLLQAGRTLPFAPVEAADGLIAAPRGANPASGASEKPRRRFSQAARKRMSAGMRAYWVRRRVQAQMKARAGRPAAK